MRIVLIRHARRDLVDRSADNGLSAAGKKEAGRLLVHFKRGNEGRDEGAGGWVLFSSPKRRCVETLAPIAALLRLEMVRSDQLLEQGGWGGKGRKESAKAFRKRVRSFLARIARTAGRESRIIICSHGDWIPEAVRRLTGAEIEIKKAGWAEIDGKRLVRLLHPDDL